MSDEEFGWIRYIIKERRKKSEKEYQELNPYEEMKAQELEGQIEALKKSEYNGKNV